MPVASRQWLEMLLTLLLPLLLLQGNMGMGMGNMGNMGMGNMGYGAQGMGYGAQGMGYGQGNMAANMVSDWVGWHLQHATACSACRHGPDARLHMLSLVLFAARWVGSCVLHRQPLCLLCKYVLRAH